MTRKEIVAKRKSLQIEIDSIEYELDDVKGQLQDLQDKCKHVPLKQLKKKGEHGDVCTDCDMTN